MEHNKSLPECEVKFEYINKGLGEAVEFRRLFAGLLTTIILAIVIQIGTFLVLWGRLTMMVEQHNDRLASIEELFPRQVKVNGKTGM